MKKIGILSLKGGVGKSTVALTLGSLLSGPKRKVLLWDIDDQGTISRWGKMKRQDLPDIYTETSKKIENMVDNIRGYDLIIFDAPPAMKQEQESVIKAVDKIIIPISAMGMVDIWSTQTFLNFLEKYKKDVRLLITRKDKRTKIGQLFRPLLEQLGSPIFKTEISERTVIALTWASGKTIDQYDPGSDIAQEFKKLGREVLLWL